MTAPIKGHPLAELSPMLPESEVEALAADIKANGQREPCVKHGSILLDGRNRIEACRRAGVEPRYGEYAGDDPQGYILSANVRRRHLRDSQRAMVAARLVHDAKTLNRKAPGLAARVVAGELTVHAAMQQAPVRPHRLKIDPEFPNLPPPLSPQEKARLEASIPADGCRHKLTTWRGIPFETREIDLPDRDAAEAFIYRNQLARKNLSKAEIVELLERNRLDLVKQRRGTDVQHNTTDGQ